MFKGIILNINDLGARTEFSAPEVHEKKVEAMVKWLRYRFSTISSSGKCDIPSKISPSMFAGIAYNHNLIPTVRSSPNIPRSIITGDKF